jgi:hypothetical protein
MVQLHSLLTWMQTLTLDLNAETYHKIFEYGFIKLIMKGIESEEEDNA